MTAGLVTIRFTSKQHPGAKLAALLAQSEDFNHCLLVDGDMAYEAVLSGVRYVPQRRAMAGVRLCQNMLVEVPDIEAMRAFLREQLGAGYDWFGAIGLPILRSDNWQDPDRWWCSELIVAALGAGGIWILDPSRVTRATPNDIYELAYHKGPMIKIPKGGQ